MYPVLLATYTMDLLPTLPLYIIITDINTISNYKYIL